MHLRCLPIQKANLTGPKISIDGETTMGNVLQNPSGSGSSMRLEDLGQGQNHTFIKTAAELQRRERRHEKRWKQRM